MSYKNFYVEINRDLGDAHVILHIEYQSEEDVIPFFLTYHEFMKYMEQYFPDEYQYINTIRSQMGGYGTKEDKVIEQLEAEQFPLKKYLSHYWETHTDKFNEWSNFIKNLKSDPQAAEKVAQMGNKLRDLVTSAPSIPNSEVLDEFERHVSKFWTEKYPEILQADADDIRLYSEILSKYILNFGMDMINHVLYIRDKLTED